MVNIFIDPHPKDHTCNEEGTMYEDKSGKRHYFKDNLKANEFYEQNYKDITSGSVCCSICNGAEIDKAHWL